MLYLQGLASTATSLDWVPVIPKLAKQLVAAGWHRQHHSSLREDLHQANSHQLT